MTTSPARARYRRVAAAVSSGSLAVLALAAVAPAEAVSGTISYTCTGDLGTFTLPVVLDTTAPPRMTTGQSTQLTATMRGTLPADRAQYATSTWAGANAVEAALTPQAIFGSVTTSATQNVAKVPLTGSDVSLLGSSAPFTYTAPTTSGSLDVTAGGLTGTLRFFKDSTQVKEVQLTCTPPNGKAPVVDTIAVSGFTTTSLTLARSTSDYGQGVGVSAKVTSSAGIPSGDVAFTVGGVVTRVKVDKDGVASTVLPDPAVGTHTVLATFVPTDVAAFLGSTSVTKLLIVSKAQTKARVPVTGKTTKTATHVGVKVRGVFDTVPTGKVGVTIKRLGKPGKWVKSRTLDDSGNARFRLRLLATGRYRVVVKYRGDANHLAVRKAQVFRVVERR